MTLEIPSADQLPPLTAGELAAMPIFPLPRVVFFPGTALPLHLFEPRYRQMIRDCTTGGPDAIAVAHLLPGFEEEYEGEPPVAPICGVGRIVWHEALPDGRHNVVLVGLERARIEELPMDGRPYRRARASILEDQGALGAIDLSGLLSCASAIAATLRTTHPGFNLGIDEGASPARVVDIVADRLVADVEERQEILETLDLGKRVERVTLAVSALLGEIQLASGQGTLH